MNTEVVFQQMVIIVILMMTGYLAYKKGVVGDAATPGMSALVVNICSPSLLIHSCLVRDPSVTDQMLLLALGAGALIYILLLLVSILLPSLLRIDQRWKKHYSLMCMFGNTGFLGIPLILAVLGEKALIYTAVINGYYNLFFYTYGYYLAGGENYHFTPGKLLNAGNVSVVLAVLIYLFEPKVPVVFEQALAYAGNATTMLAMVVIGISLAKTDLRSFFTEKTIYVFIFLRFILVPVLLLGILKLFIKDELLLGVLVILTAVPVGNMPMMRVAEIGEDTSVLAKGTILSTILAVVTIPVVTLFL